LLSCGRKYFNEGEAAFEGLADLVEIVTVETIECANDAKIRRDRQFSTTPF
jgi:hypothetical protein